MIEINTYARWRINDARIFYKAVRNEDQAKTRLDDLLDGAARTVIAAHDLVEVIRSTQREAAQPVTENAMKPRLNWNRLPRAAQRWHRKSSPALRAS